MLNWIIMQKEIEAKGTGVDRFLGSRTLDFNGSLEVREAASSLNVCQLWTDYR